MTHCPPWVATWRERQGCGCDFCLGVDCAVYTAGHLAWAKLEAVRLREVLGWGNATESPSAKPEDGVTLVYGTLVPNASAPARPREPASRVLTWPWDETKEKP